MVFVLDENTDSVEFHDAQSCNEDDIEDDDMDREGDMIDPTLEEFEEEIFEVSESFEETQRRIETENRASEQSERQAARERAKRNLAKAARRSVGFQGQDDSVHDITFNEGLGDSPPRRVPTPPRTVPTPRSALKRKDRGSAGASQNPADKTQRVLRISEVFPASDWPLGMTQEQVC